jgi:SOS response regulatory protein OraA/RecX
LAGGVRLELAEGAVATRTSAGAVDDARTAGSRARSLAGRGWGDDAVTARLAAEGFAPPDVEAAVASLDPERARAEALAATVDDARAAWKLLARRGFADETIEDVAGLLDSDR